MSLHKAIAMQDLAQFMPEAEPATVRTLVLFALAEGHEPSAGGMHGIVLNSHDPQVLLNAFQEMGRGNLPPTEDIARRVKLHVVAAPDETSAASLTALSPREKEVLRALVEGLSYKMIGTKLKISFETVRSHLKRIYEKLQVHNNTEAVAKALKCGFPV